MDVIIIGAGGHGKVVLDILQHSKHRVVGFVDADPSLAGTKVGGLPVFGSPNQLAKLKQKKIKGAIIAIGDNRTRRSYVPLVLEHKLKLISAIHPSASVAESAQIGVNVVIAAHATVCVDAIIYDSAIINTSAVVDHECEIGCGAHICPGVHLAGRVRVGENAMVGLGANVIQCLSIGNDCVVGAGAVVIRDVPDGATVVGVPARAIRKNV